jgi:hypothetical protein
MPYTSSNHIFEAIAGQIDSQLSDKVGGVVIFDGDLTQAIEQHLNESGLGDTTIFVGMPESTAETLDGCGLPMREMLAVDVYVVVRAKGRSRYGIDRERLWDITDSVVNDVFSCDNRTTLFRERVYGLQFVRRARMQGQTPELLATRVEFTVEGANT